MKSKTLIQMAKNAAQAEAMLKQLGNANRLMILCALVEGSKTVTELSQYVDLSQSSLSQHLASLKGAGLVDSEKKGQNVIYSISSMEAKALLSVLHVIYCK